jgi:hypothetical protein
MAAWQFDAHLIPNEAIRVRYGHPPLTISREDFDGYDWWRNKSSSEVAAGASLLLQPNSSWSEKLRTWGESDGNRIDLVIESGLLQDVFLRIDLRDISYTFLARLLLFVQKNDCLLLTEGGYLLRPSMRLLLEAIRRSKAFRFFSDPEGFFNELARLDKLKT